MKRADYRCRVCHTRKLHAQQRCFTCYQFLRRNGEDRPWSLIVRAGERQLERRMRFV